MRPRATRRTSGTGSSRLEAVRALGHASSLPPEGLLLALQQLCRRAGRIEPPRHHLVEQLLHRRRPRAPAPRAGGAAGRAASASTSFIRLRRRRSASVPCSMMCAWCSAIFSASSSTPSPRLASVLTIGTRQPSCGPSESTPRISRTIVSVSGWSDLLTTITSGISITPALSAWIESPEPGISTSTTVSAWSMMSTSAWPTPTVSSNTSSLPRGVHQQRGLQRGLGQPAERAAAGHRADEHAGVEEVVGEADAVAQQRALA